MQADIQEGEIVRSPVPIKPVVLPVEMTFCEALKKTLEGKKITRVEWEDKTTFGEMRNNELMIFIRGEYHSWTIVPGDITADDWYVLPIEN